MEVSENLCAGTELTAFRRGPNGNTISLTLAQLLEEGKGIAASSQTDWSLKNNYIQPSLLMALLGKLGDSLPPLDATMALDLRGYHLEPLSTEEFVKIFKAMQLSSLQGLIIQFGCEVFVPKLFAALYQVGCEAWLNTRVYLDLPFVSQTLEEMLAQIIQLNIKSQKRLDFLESKYDQPAKALKEGCQ